MKLLNSHRFALLAALALILAAVSARADSFLLDYTFGGAAYSYASGTTVELAFSGTLSGNLITGISNASLTIDGTSFGTVYGYGVNGNSLVGGGSVISLNGTQNNFLFADTPIYSEATTSFASLTSSEAASYNGNFPYTQVLNGLYFVAYDENPPGTGPGLNSTYKVTDLTSHSVPDNGATIALLGMAVAGMIGLRRKLR